MLILRQKGFTKLSALRGGYVDWEYLGGATERGADTNARTLSPITTSTTTQAAPTPSANPAPSFTPVAPKKGTPSKSRSRTRRPTRSK